MPTIVSHTYEEPTKHKVMDFYALIEPMKVLVATEKPFAKKAVDAIREVVEGAGYELALLEK